MSLAAIKADLPFLLNVLGLERDGNHCSCRFCGSSDGMSVQLGESGAYFRCHVCDAKGDIVSAFAMIHGITPSAAIKVLTGEDYKPVFRTASVIRPIAEPIPPTPNKAKLDAIFAQAFESILDGRADNAIRGRGLKKEWLLRSPNLGYFPVDRTWVIRVALPDGEAVALKLHRDGKRKDKSLWLRLGTEPSDQPRHGFSTLWPSPEWYLADPLLIAEGELKAAALISAGFSATAPTTGAGFKWTPGSIARIAGRHVVVVFDQDDAGNKFRINTVTALTGAVASIKEITFNESDLKGACE